MAFIEFLHPLGKVCPVLDPPDHGSLMIPCIHLYNSTCISKCNGGYYLTGSDESRCTMENKNTTWKPDDAVCNRKSIFDF